MADVSIVTVSATHGDKASSQNEAGDEFLPLSAIPATVDLTVTAPAGTTSVSATRGDTPVTLVWSLSAEDGAAVLKAELKVDSADDLGTFQFVVEGLEPATLLLTQEKTLENSPIAVDEPNTVAETQEGVFGPGFAALTGGAAVIVVGLIVAAIWGGAGHQRLPDVPKVLHDDEWVSATYSEQAAFVLLLVAAGAAALLLVVGAWLAALETRGRLSRKVTVTQTGEATRGVVADVGNAVSGVVDSLRWARGTIAVLSVAGIVMVAVICSATIIAVDGDDRPKPVESTPSATSSASPTAPAAPMTEPPDTTPATPPGPDPVEPDAQTDDTPPGDDPTSTCTDYPEEAGHAGRRH